MSFKIRPVHLIPKTDGYRFTAVLTDGTRVRCKVVKDSDGRFKLEGPVTRNVTGWHP